MNSYEVAPSAGEAGYNPGSPITIENVREYIAYYRREFTPRTPEYDEATGDLLDYMSGQLDVIDSDLAFAYPVPFFDREAQDPSELAAAVVEAAAEQRNAVRDRGRGHEGAKGDYFWVGVETLDSKHEQLARRFWPVAQRLGVDVATWYERVMNPPRLVRKSRS